MLPRPILQLRNLSIPIIEYNTVFRSPNTDRERRGIMKANNHKNIINEITDK